MYSDQTVSYSGTSRSYTARMRPEVGDEREPVTPEKYLLTAIVERAFLDLQQHPNSLFHRNACKWLRARDPVTSKFSLRWIFDQMGLNVAEAVDAAHRQAEKVIQETNEIFERVANGEDLKTVIKEYRRTLKHIS